MTDPSIDLTPHWPATPDAGGAERPNIVLVVLDDVGFAQLGCYGSDIDTPTMDRLAAGGLQYSNLHSTAMCSPTRASLLTGRNHHTVGVGAISHYSNGQANNTGKISPDAVALPELLRTAGYGTTAIGKWHLAPIEETNAVGPHDAWPLGRGFDRFYGFLDSMTDQFHPDLYQDNHRLDLQPPADYHLSEDLTDRAITAVREHRSLAPHRPFFLYLGYGACHAPHQSPPAFRQKYRGRFDDGWDEARQRCYERQSELGVIPDGTALAPRNPGVPLWDELSDEERALFAREQEAFAAFLDHTDACLGRVVDELDRLGILDSSIVILMSDNGASGDAGNTGTLNEMRAANGIAPGPVERAIPLDAIGGPDTFNEYPRGWAMAGNTPLRWYKRNVYGGGARVPFIVHWPDGISAPGVRHQFHHVIDVMPTLLDVIGLDVPQTVNGRSQIPIHGSSMKYSFDDADAPTPHHVQYFEMLGDRGLWSDGWKAVALHESGRDYAEDRWQLFHLDEDFSEADDLADEHPAKLHELVRQWWEQAELMRVLPLDDRQGARCHIMPPWMTERTRWVLSDGIAPITSDYFAVIDRSFDITADVELADTGAEGVLLAIGGGFGGQSLFVQDGRLVFDCNLFGEHRVLRSSEPVTAGRHQLTVSFARTEPFAGTCELRIDGAAVGSMHVTGMARQMIGPQPTTVGRDTASAVSTLYRPPFAFTGRLFDVTLTLGAPTEQTDTQLYERRLAEQ